MAFVVVTLLILIALGVPLGVALGAASMIYIALFTNMDPVAVGQAMFFFLSSYTMMAIPFFVYAGYLMDRTGLITKLFDLAESMLGWIPGGFGVATVATCVILGAISGSGAAIAAAMSLIAIPRMIERKYPASMAGGLVAYSGGIGLLIPPSVSLLIFGIVTETSIPKLFAGGIIPGLVTAGSLMLLTIVLAIIYKVPTTGRFDVRRFVQSFITSLPAIGMPVVVLGGLYGGYFTPTESGAVACGYALVYGFLARGKRFLKELFPATKDAINTTTMIFFLMASVGLFQYVAANMYWPQSIARSIIAMDLSPTAFLIGYMLLLLVMGMFVDGISMILLTVPVLFPAASQLGINPIQLGVLITVMVEIGAVTPPVGINLFAVSGVSKIPIGEVIRGSIPYFAVTIAMLLLLLFVPSISTWLPSLV